MDYRWVKVDKKYDGIYYNAVNDTWSYRINSYGIQKRKSGFMTKAEAKAEREAVLEELEQRGKKI